MALDTDTINTAGLGSPNFGVKLPPMPVSSIPKPPASIQGRMGAAQTDIAKLTGQSEEKQKTIEQANEDTIKASRAKFEATREGEQKVVDEMRKAPEAPTEEKAQPYQKPQANPEQMRDAMMTMMIGSAMIGFASRTPYNNMATALTGAMEGFAKKDDQLVEQSFKEYDRHLATVKQHNEAMQREFENNWKRNQTNIAVLKQENELIAAKYGEEIMEAALRSKGASEGQAFVENRLKQKNHELDRLTTVSEHEKDRAQKAAQHSQSMAAAYGKGGGPAAGAGKRGADYLKTLSPQYQDLVQGLAEGRINPTSLSTKGGHREQILGMVAQYDPTYNQYDVGNINKAVRDFSTGKQGNNVRSFNVALEHLDTLKELGDAMKNSDVPKVNELKNWWKTNTGQEAPADFNAAKQLVADEVVKAIVGTGGGVHDREEAAKTINAASSPEQLSGVINTYKSLFGGQLVGLEQQYSAATRRNDFRSRFLTEKGREAANLGHPQAVPGMPAAPQLTGGAAGGWDDAKEKRYQELKAKQNAAQ